MAHTSQPFPFAFFNDKIVQTKEAQVSIMTNALQYGTGVFGGIRGYYNKEKGFLSIFRPDDHFRRFLSSLKIIGVSIDYSHEQLLKITRDLVKKNNLQSDNVFKYAQYMIPLGDYLPTDKGNSVMVSSWRRVSDNAIPSRAKISGSYINSALAKKEAQQNGYEEAILLNEEGHVAEGSAMNLFMVRDGVLITPSRSDDILEGIPRRSIIQLARDMQIPVEERTIYRSELYVADEMFFS